MCSTLPRMARRAGASIFDGHRPRLGDARAAPTVGGQAVSSRNRAPPCARAAISLHHGTPVGGPHRPRGDRRPVRDRPPHRRALPDPVRARRARPRLRPRPAPHRARAGPGPARVPAAAALRRGRRVADPGPAHEPRPAAAPVVRPRARHDGHRGGRGPCRGPRHRLAGGLHAGGDRGPDRRARGHERDPPARRAARGPDPARGRGPLQRRDRPRRLPGGRPGRHRHLRAVRCAGDLRGRGRRRDRHRPGRRPAGRARSSAGSTIRRSRS